MSPEGEEARPPERLVSRTVTPMAAEPPLLAGSDLSKRFGGLQVLRRVSFAVRAREIVALIGPNGAGKTTLFNLISGLERPAEGSIRLAGRDVTRLPGHAIARLGLGRTFQTPRPFLELSAADNVRTAALFAREPAPAPEALLALVGLEEDAGAPAGRLPPARRKLVELAMVLALRPRVILLDEILGGLTPAEAGRFTALLRRLREEWGIALFWIDHVMWAVMETAERIIVLHHGEVIAEGDPGSVARDAAVLQAYLGRAAR
jgi:branched-chain amino acid transport system ATP-binding protein